MGGEMKLARHAELESIARKIAAAGLEFDTGTIFGGLGWQSGENLFKITHATATDLTLTCTLTRSDGVSAELVIHDPKGIVLEGSSSLVIETATWVEYRNRYERVAGRTGPALALNRLW